MKRKYHSGATIVWQVIGQRIFYNFVGPSHCYNENLHLAKIE